MELPEAVIEIRLSKDAAVPLNWRSIGYLLLPLLQYSGGRKLVLIDEVDKADDV